MQVLVIVLLFSLHLLSFVIKINNMDNFFEDAIKGQQFKNIEELQAFLNKKVTDHNNASRADFDGISPDQMRHFLYAPLGADSPLQINKVDNAAFDRMPFFRTLETLLQIIHREKEIKLTPKGNLPLKVCAEITEHRFWNEELSDLYKQRKEEDFQVLHTAKIVAHIGNLTRKANGKLTITKATAKLLDTHDRNALFRSAFEIFMLKFNWAYHDLYSSPLVGQSGWAFTFYLLHKYGALPQKTGFYAEKYLQAFPVLANGLEPRFSTVEDELMRAYNTRTFSRYLRWWGFVERQKSENSHSISNLMDDVYRTPIFDAVFSLKM